MKRATGGRFKIQFSAQRPLRYRDVGYYRVAGGGGMLRLTVNSISRLDHPAEKTVVSRRAADALARRTSGANAVSAKIVTPRANNRVDTGRNAATPRDRSREVSEVP